MDEALFIIFLLAWVISGFIGAGWLMLKGYTMEMFGCLGVLYGGVLALIAFFGPLMFFIAWALPSRTDPTQQGGIKKLLTPKANRKQLPPPQANVGPPQKSSHQIPVARRPQIPRNPPRSLPPNKRASKSPPSLHDVEKPKW